MVYRPKVFMLAGSTGWRRSSYTRSSVVRLHGRVPIIRKLLDRPSGLCVKGVYPNTQIGAGFEASMIDVSTSKSLPSRLIGRTDASEASDVGSSPAWAANEGDRPIPGLPLQLWIGEFVKTEHDRAVQAAYMLNRRNETDAWLREHKESNPCTDCGGYFHFSMMDFDHVNGDKRSNIAWMKCSNIDTLKSELDKCELVCSNCHRYRTYTRRLARAVQ